MFASRAKGKKESMRGSQRPHRWYNLLGGLCVGLGLGWGVVPQVVMAHPHHTETWAQVPQAPLKPNVASSSKEMRGFFETLKRLETHKKGSGRRLIKLMSENRELHKLKTPTAAQKKRIQELRGKIITLLALDRKLKAKAGSTKKPLPRLSQALGLKALQKLGYKRPSDGRKERSTRRLSSKERAAVTRAAKLLGRWRANEAAKLLKALYAEHKAMPEDVAMLLARIRFYQGRYKEAIKLYEVVGNASYLNRRTDGYIGSKAAYKITRKYKEIQSPHFIVTFPSGREEILAAYAINALERAYQRMGKLFGYYPPDRVRVEFLSDAMQLADMSPLTEADIARTGTIALCKYNRLMVTSPSSLLRGYRWLDTLIHEYTHLVINRMTTGIPIWMHEGLARYAEILWRSDTPAPLAPYSETLLAKAIRKNKLIAFKRMHPSMAKLPSQKDAALAYAQVYMLIRYFVKKYGQGAIPKVLRLVFKGKKVPQAFAQVVKMPFPTFLEQWKAHLRKHKLTIHKGMEAPKKIIKGHRPPNAQKKLPDLWARPKSWRARGNRYLQLGEMLRTQGRMKGALLEYLKAERHWKNRVPRLQNKIARLQLHLRKYKQAVRPLRWSLKLYPSYMTTFVQLGRAYYHLGKLNKSRKVLEEALQINPFHPQVHIYLLNIYKKQGDKAKYKRERRIYRKLQEG